MAGARRFDDLDAYKLAVQLRREIVRLSTIFDRGLLWKFELAQ